MTYYQQLVKHAAVAMDLHPRSTIAMDAATFEVIAHGCDSKKVSEQVNIAVDQGKTSVILEKPRKPESWIL